MKPFGIAGIQMNLNHGNNLDAIEQRINTVVSIYPWVEMIVLSELALFGPLHAYAQQRLTHPVLTGTNDRDI
jgi:hypothetical protein